MHFREVRIHGAFGRGTAFRRALRLMPALAVKRLVTAQFSLDRIEEGFAHAAAGRGVKTMITPGALPEPSAAVRDRVVLKVQGGSRSAMRNRERTVAALPG